MALNPRVLTHSGLNRARRAAAPRLPDSAPGVAAVPVTGTNAGQGLALLGDAAGAFGGDMVQLFHAERRAHEAAALSKSEVSLTEALTRAAEEAPLDHAAFKTRAAAIGEEWLNGLPPDIREQGALLLNQRVGRFGQVILDREYAHGREETKAELVGRMTLSQTAALAAARSGDLPVLEENAAAYEAARQALMDAGMLTAGQFVQAGKDLADGLERQEALAGLDRVRGQGLAVAEAYIERFRAGEVHGAIKHPDQRARIVNEMERSLADLRRQQREREAAVNRAWREQFGDARDKVKVAAEAVVKGRQFAGFDDLKAELGAVAAEDERYAPLVKVLDDAETIATLTQEFAALPPEQQRRRLDARRAAVEDSVDNDVLDAWEAVHEGTVKALREDPHGWAGAHLDEGYRSPPLNPLTVADLAATLSERVMATDRLKHYTRRQGIPFLRPGEKAALRDMMQALAPAEQALRLQTLAQTAGPYAGEVLRALSPDDPLMAHAGGLMAQGREHYQTAALLLEGAGIETVQLPADARVWFNEETGTAFGENSRTREAVFAASAAIYKATALRRGMAKDDDAAEEVYRQSVQKSLARGGDVEPTGGLAEAGGAMVVVPPGMPVRVIETIFDGLDDERGLEALKAMSVGGAPPTDSSKRPFDPAEHEFWPVPSSNGRFFLSLTDPALGPPAYLRGSGRDGLYEMDVTRTPGWLLGKVPPPKDGRRRGEKGTPRHAPVLPDPWRQQQQKETDQ